MIADLKDLKHLFKLCRSQGITDFKMQGIEIKFGEMPQGTKSLRDMEADTQDEISPYANFPKGDLTPSQLVFYSSGGVPEDDPENTDYKINGQAM